ncbi:CUB and zona pellucida-like domain-containing protein 1 [Labeo rohita]|uniref:CUB and zona pellucida-like domain-containing protein 1 n=1 Tax=Labeo rohita TaxID=84645 RepID=A0ABQ8LF15_LABRO|nr:CUB and zona pellucida-like domain-containing protein 1 [Labeo rohita]
MTPIIRSLKEKHALLLLASTATASHYIGGLMTFTPRKNPDGTYLVDIRLREGHYTCDPYDYWYCGFGDCGSKTLVSGRVDSSVSSRWCQTEGVMKRTVPNNSPFQLEKNSCCWISDIVSGIGNFKLLTYIDLGERSDTSKPNTSPVVTTLPVVRVPQNCARNYNFLSYDSDHDQVRCRYGLLSANECGMCNQHTGFTLDQNTCTLSYSFKPTGVYAFELVMEDYPTQIINLNYIAVASAVRSPFNNASFNPPLSKIPLQFAWRLLHHRVSRVNIFLVSSTQHLITENIFRLVITDVVFSGPLNSTKETTTTGEYVIKWTPTSEEYGQNFAFCFTAEGQYGLRSYQSEMRCVIVVVEAAGPKAQVTCTKDTMSVSIERATISGIHGDHLRVNNNASCTVSSNSTHVFTTFSLNGCGTQIDETDEQLIFKNTIVTYDDPNHVITRKHEFEIEVLCKYQKKSSITTMFDAHRPAVNFTERGFGSFSYQFEFFQSDSFGNIIDPSSYPLEYSVGQPIYMEIAPVSVVQNTEIFLESCVATPYDNPNYPISYPIITNGCEVDETMNIYTSHQPNVFISCSVILCQANNPNTRCAQGCTNGTQVAQSSHVHKREAAIQTGSHFISQGPLRMRRSASLTEAISPNLNLNIVFVAGCVIAVVAMVCGVMVYKSRGSKVKYQLLNVISSVTMAHAALLLLISLTVSVGSAISFYGASMTFMPGNRYPDGTVEMHFYYRESGKLPCDPQVSWVCDSGDCGNLTYAEPAITDHDHSGQILWCQSECHIITNVSGDEPFTLRGSGCCWANNVHDVREWMLRSLVDTRQRSDTRTTNRSPVSATIPNIRVPQNCFQSLHLLVHDPDGDHVRCKCQSCQQHPNIYLDEDSCTLSNNGTLNMGLHVLEFTLEDYPPSNITLTNGNGNSSVRNPYNQTGNTDPTPLSQVPLHPNTSAQLCTRGEQAKFTDTNSLTWRCSTRSCGTCSYYHPPCPELRQQVSGPWNMSTTLRNASQGLTEATLTWTPQESDLHHHVPVCFAAETLQSQSEMRCIVIVVAKSMVLSGEAEVFCEDSSISIAVSKASMKGIDQNWLQLRDPTCSLTSNDTHILGTMSLNTCGTMMEDSGDFLVFRNEINSFENPNEVITRRSQVKISFSCQYPKVASVSNHYINKKSDYIFTESSFGTFGYSFDIFTNNNFSSRVDPSLYPLEINLMDVLYMGIAAHSALPEVRLFVECIMDDTVEVYQSDSRTYDFGIQAFKFTGGYSEVYITCSVILCAEGSSNSRCAQGCLRESAHKRRRDVSKETARHYITQGPFRLARQTQHSAAASENGGSLHISAGTGVFAGLFIVSIVVLVGLLVYNAKKTRAPDRMYLMSSF